MCVGYAWCYRCRLLHVLQICSDVPKPFWTIPGGEGVVHVEGGERERGLKTVPSR